MLEESMAEVNVTATKCRIPLVIDYLAHSTLGLSAWEIGCQSASPRRIACANPDMSAPRDG